MTITNLGWVAIYPDKKIKQYPLFKGETPINALGEWKDFMLFTNLPLTFSVGLCSVNLINGYISLNGKILTAPPSTHPEALVYYRKHRASANGGEGIQCWHYLGYVSNSDKILVCVPDDGTQARLVPPNEV
jgi:hypothetical protein